MLAQAEFLRHHIYFYFCFYPLFLFFQPKFALQSQFLLYLFTPHFSNKPFGTVSGLNHLVLFLRQEGLELLLIRELFLKKLPCSSLSVFALWDLGKDKRAAERVDPQTLVWAFCTNLTSAAGDSGQNTSSF